jgi:acyl-CoA synthetase (NDP forming)
MQRRERYLAQRGTRVKVQQATAPDQQRLETARRIIQQARQQGNKALTEAQAKGILELYGIPVPKRQLARNAAEAARAAQEISFPVVMKIASADITHKTEAGGVRLGISDAQEAARACEAILANAKAYNAAATVDGVLVEEMITNGVEVLVGFKQDSRFGPMVTFGPGGIFVELLRDISLRMAPLDEAEALAMIQETKAYPLLTGFRGEQPKDVGALSRLLLSVSRLAQDLKEELSELDVNPCIVLPQGHGVRAVDALMVLK